MSFLEPAIHCSDELQAQGVSLLGLQDIADFRKKLDIGRRRCRRFIDRLLFFHGAKPVHALDHQEDDEGENDEVDHNSDEAAISEDRALLARFFQRRCRDGARQCDEVIGEIETATGDRADDRHDDIIDKRCNNAGKGAADNDTDRQIDNIALRNE